LTDNERHFLLRYDTSQQTKIPIEHIAIVNPQLKPIDPAFITNTTLGFLENMREFAYKQGLKEILSAERPKNIGLGTWDAKRFGEPAEWNKVIGESSKLAVVTRDLIPWIFIIYDVGTGAYKNVNDGASWIKTVSDVFADLSISITMAFLPIMVGSAVAGPYGATAGFAVSLLLIIALYFAVDGIKYSNGLTGRETIKKIGW
jgi:hypothetical protein